VTEEGLAQGLPCQLSGHLALAFLVASEFIMPPSGSQPGGYMRSPAKRLECATLPEKVAISDMNLPEAGTFQECSALSDSHVWRTPRRAPK